MLALPRRKSLSVFDTSACVVKRMLTFYGSKFSQNILKASQESVKSNEALIYEETSSKVFSGVRSDDGNKKLAEEIKGWMIKRLGYKIKDSGLV
jgi:hypothetical protein